MQEYENDVKYVAITRKKVSRTLLELTIGSPESFPLIQFDSVYTTIQRLQKKYRANGFKWSTRTTDENIEVTRVA